MGATLKGIVQKFFPGLLILTLLSTTSYAQYSAGDSVKIMIQISSCPMAFVIDSLPHNPYLPGSPEQDTFWLWYEYEGFHTTHPTEIKWQTIYIVGSRVRDASGTPIEPPQMQALLVINTGCPPLDFELSTYAQTSTGEPWWEPNDTNEIARGKYVLQALATGYGTPRLQWADTVRFQTPAAYYWVVPDTLHPKAIKDSILPDGNICCFYSEDHLGFAEIPTIDSHGVNLQPTDTVATDTLNGVFFLHLALTTPSAATAYTETNFEGVIVLVIQARVRGE